MDETPQSPPYNRDAEQCLLGAAMIDTDSALELTQLVRADDLYEPAHALAWQAITDELAAGNAPTLVGLVARLKADGNLERAGNVPALAGYMEAVFDASCGVRYAQLVLEFADRRRIQAMAQKLLKLTHQPGHTTSAELLSQAQGVVFQGAEAISRRSRAADVVSQARDAYDRALEPPLHSRGMPCGFQELDDLLGGMRDGGMYVVAGRPSMGKSSLALQVLDRCTIKAQLPGMLFTLEVQAADVVDQIMRQRARLSSDVFGDQLTDRDVRKLDEARQALEASVLTVEDDKRLDLAGLRARAQLLHMRTDGGLRLIVVDYLQLLRLGHRVESRVQEVGELSRELKHLAGELGCPVVVLSQLNRQVEQREDKRPRMSDLRESGSIEQDADAVLLCYREGYYDDRANQTTAEVIVAKNRHGRTGVATLNWDGPTRRFLDGPQMMAEMALDLPEPANVPPTVPNW